MSGFDAVFSIFPYLFGVVFILVFAVILTVVVRSLRQSAHDRKQPRIPVPARVAGRRTQVWGGSGDSAAHTTQYATFEFANGERLEFSVPASEAGYLVEGDAGVLTFQGSKFISFTRGLSETGQSDPPV